MSATDKIHTRLAQHGWMMTKNMPEGRYFYQRGEQWIELEPDGCAYFGVDDRRMSNGTHESIVKKFGETPDPAKPAFTMFAEPAVRELLEAMERKEITLDQAFDACRHAIRRQEEGDYDAVFLTEMKQGIAQTKE